jgi:hypothetical protein
MRRLIGAEMAVSLVLLVAAGLFIRSAVNLQTYDFSFDPDAVFTAAVTTDLPGIGSARRTVAVEGTHLPSDPVLPATRYQVTTAGFFATFHVPILTGRPLDTRDRADGMPVAVVTASFERLYLPEGAVGRRIAFPEDIGEPVWRTIVGVVPDLLAGGLQSETQDSVYVPFAQAPPARFEIAVRSRTTAEVLAAPIREAVSIVDRDAALSFMRSLRDAINAANAAFAWVSTLFLVAGGLLNVSPFDPIVFGAVLGVLLCAGWLGCLGPALKATRINPLSALGAE